MSNGTKKTKEQALEVQRKLPEKAYSKQPRISDPRTVFGSIFGWLQSGVAPKEQEYRVNSTPRDEWLRAVWRDEAHLAGVLNSAVSIDKNRGWTMIGGRNQVLRYTTMAHYADDGMGWRYYFSREAQSFYATDLGALTENGRDGPGGPLRAIYHVDSARCRLTGKREEPLMYLPASGGEQKWKSDDFFRAVSMPTDDEKFHGLGFCAISRCIELAKLMMAVYEHDKEMLGAKAPKGLLILRNISQTQWDEAMEAREEKLRAKEREYYGGVAVLASGGPDEPDAKLVALSQLPKGFDLKVFTEQLMYGYALAFGYDPSEFWPVQYGAMGRGRESDIQHMKATGKGGMDFTASYQEQFVAELPDSLHFEFEQRDIEGDILDADLADKISDWVTKLYEAGRASGEPLLDREQALSLLAERQLIPEEWSIIEEEVQATDVEEAGRSLKVSRERALTSSRVLTAIERFPQEPVISYTYDPLRYPLGREVVLWPRGADAVRRHTWPVARVDSDEDGEILFGSTEVVITEGDVQRAIVQAAKRLDPEVAELLTAPPMTEEEMNEAEERTIPLWRKILGR